MSPDMRLAALARHLHAAGTIVAALLDDADANTWPAMRSLGKGIVQAGEALGELIHEQQEKAA